MKIEGKDISIQHIVDATNAVPSPRNIAGEIASGRSTEIIQERILHSTDVLESLQLTKPNDLIALVDRARDQERLVNTIVKKYKIEEYKKELEKIAERVSAADLQAHFDVLNGHLANGGTLDDPALKDNPAADARRLADYYRVAAAAGELAAHLENVPNTSLLPSGDLPRVIRGSVRSTIKAGSFVAGTVATGKGIYASSMVLLGGSSIPAAALYWGSMGTGLVVMGTIVYGGHQAVKHGGFTNAFKAQPVKMGIWAAASLTSGLFASAFVLKAVATTERAGIYGKDVLEKVKTFDEIIKNGSTSIPKAASLIRKIMERRLAIVEAEKDPSKRGAGVGDTKTLSGFGPVAQSLQHLLSGKSDPLPTPSAKQLPVASEKQKNPAKGTKGQKGQTAPQPTTEQSTTPSPAGSLIAKAEQVRVKHTIEPGTSIEQKYQQILDQFAEKERKDALLVLSEFIKFLEALEKKDPAEYGMESIDPRKPSLDPNLIGSKKEELKVALKRVSEKYTEGAKTVGATFLKNFVSDGLKELGLAAAGIEIPVEQITIDTAILDEISSFNTSALPFPQGDEWEAIEKFRAKHNLPKFLLGASTDSQQIRTYMVILLTYLILVDNSAPILQTWYDWNRRRKERKRLPPALEKIHSKEDVIADKIVAFINGALVPAQAGASNAYERRLIDADEVRYVLRKHAFGTEKGLSALAADSAVGGVLSGAGHLVWGEPLADTATYNRYEKYLDTLEKQMGTPAGIAKLANAFIPQGGTFLSEAIAAISNPARTKGTEVDASGFLNDRLTLARRRANFLKIRILRTEKILQSIAAQVKADPTRPDIYRSVDRPLDGSGTIFFDQPEFRHGYAMNLFRSKLNEDIAEFHRLAKEGIASAQELLLQQVSRQNIAVNLARQETIQLSQGQFPEFLLGVAPTTPSDTVGLLSPEQGIDAALAVQLQGLLASQMNTRNASEALQYVDTHSLVEARTVLQSNPTFSGKKIYTGLGYRVDAAGFGGLSVIARISDPNDAKNTAEISYIFDPKETSENLNLAVKNWITLAEPELEARTRLATIASEARTIRKQIAKIEDHAPFTTVLRIPVTEINSQDTTIESVTHLLKLLQQETRLRTLLKDTESVFTDDDATLPSINHVDSELLKVFRQPADQLSFPGLESPAQIKAVKDALHEVVQKNSSTHSFEITATQTEIRIVVLNKKTNVTKSIDLSNIQSAADIERLLT